MLDRETVSVHDLEQAAKPELEALFEICDPFDIHELRGPINGKVINGNLVFAHRAGLWLTNRIWKGKVFYPEKTAGRNLLALGPLGRKWFKFKTGVAPSMDYAGPVYTLRYNYRFSLNPWPIRPILDEMRKIRDGLYLGTGNIKLLGRYYLFDWYILHSISHSR